MEGRNYLWDKPAAFNFKAQTKCRQFRRTCHSQGLKVRPGDVEAHSTLSSISHVTIENLTQFLSFLLNFNSASENHKELSPLGNMAHTSSGCIWRGQPPDVEGSCKYI